MFATQCCGGFCCFGDYSALHGLILETDSLGIKGNQKGMLNSFIYFLIALNYLSWHEAMLNSYRNVGWIKNYANE